MTERIKKLNEVQEEAVAALESNDFKGCVMSAPGTGKSFIAFKTLYRMLELGLISKGADIVFLAETVVREKTIWNEEAPKYKKLFGKDVLSDFNMVFHCYQAKPNQIHGNFKNVDVVIQDEQHDCLTELYHPVLTKNKCKYIIGLTGAMSMEANVFPSKIPEGMLNTVAQSDEATKDKKIRDFITKGQMLDAFCPVVFKYTTAQAINDGVISRFKTFEIVHKLDDTNRTIQTWKSYPNLGTELDYYSKRNSVRTDFRAAKYRKMSVSREMVRFLYTLPSKTNIVKAILHRLKDEKTLIFGVQKDPLRLITENVVESHNYNELIDGFNSGKINVIASAKMLKQGITLEGVQNIIFHSYDSKWHNMEQKRARIRWIEGGYAKLFFIVTQGTFEEKWYMKLRQQKDSTGQIVQVHDLNVVSKVKSETLVNWYKTQI